MSERSSSTTVDGAKRVAYKGDELDWWQHSNRQPSFGSPIPAWRADRGQRTYTIHEFGLDGHEAVFA